MGSVCLAQPLSPSLLRFCSLALFSLFLLKEPSHGGGGGALPLSPHPSTTPSFPLHFGAAQMFTQVLLVSEMTSVQPVSSYTPRRVILTCRFMSPTHIHLQAGGAGIETFLPLFFSEAAVQNHSPLTYIADYKVSTPFLQRRSIWRVRIITPYITHSLKGATQGMFWRILEEGKFRFQRTTQ